MQFKQFADAINKKFTEMMQQSSLYRVNVSSDELWETYQNSYSPEDNPIFRERRVHDCQTCKSFIKRIGTVVTIIDNKVDTVWNTPNIPEPYATVAAKLHKLVSSASISGVFLTDENLAGKEYTMEFNPDNTPFRNWEHFYAVVEPKFIITDVATVRGNIESTVQVFSRALKEFSLSSLETVEDLCSTIYKGEEFQPTVSKFIEAKKAYEAAENKTNFIWSQYTKYPAKIRNTAIGTLIIDVSEGLDLESAVAKYEKVVAPSNYKRTSAVVTETMKKQAVQTIKDLGLEQSLERRHATLEDISINNVLFANASAQKKMQSALDDILDTVTDKTVEAPKNAQEITINDFLETVLPNSKNISVLLENRHMSNLVSLVAPVHPDAPNMLKWNNNFSWSYAGEMTDSMKERVKAAGGSVTGDLRFSIQWNEDSQDSQNDLDAHCNSPKDHIYFSYKNGSCTGKLDVDIRRPGSNTAVENITWADKQKMPNGVYTFSVHDYTSNNKKGFRAQVEILGTIYEYNCQSFKGKREITVAEVTLKDGQFTIKHHLPEANTSKTEWDVATKTYQEVSTIMLSPNHWDDQKIGNKHYFFMLKDCNNPEKRIRGFYNEFLNEKLRPHRKVFEVLSSKMICEHSTEQLSGIGFNSSTRNDLYVKVDSRPYKILF